jgi:ABC-type transporter Mla subunit MlaD
MTDHNEGNQSNGDNDNNSDGDEEELVIERIGEPRQTEQLRLLTEIAQSIQDASDELRLMNDNIENVTREIRGTKEAIRSLTDMLSKYMDKKSE